MKNLLVIGGASGIGQSICDLSQFDHTYATFNKSAPSEMNGVSYHHLNVMEQNLDLSFLPDVIDGFVYCPGSINLKPFTRFSPSDFVEDFKLQVVGFTSILKQILPNLKKSSHPSIVVFSTVAVQNGFPFHTQVAASKGAVEGLTRSLAAELSPNIRINCIAPSITDTPLAASILRNDEKKEANAKRHALQKIGEPKDIAHMTHFLLNEKSNWITGQVFAVDGGMSSVKM